MKKATVFILSIFITISTFAQSDTKSEGILNAMSKKYQAYKSFKAEFTYSLEDAKGKVKDSYSGQISVKGNKYLLKVAGQEIVTDGVTMWTYMKEEKECNVSDYSPEENEFTPTKIPTMYKKGFKNVFVEEVTEAGVKYSVIDLVPNDKNKSYFKVRLKISKSDSSIKSWKVFDRNGNRYVYLLGKFSANQAFEDKLFKFDKSKYYEAKNY